RQAVYDAAQAELARLLREARTRDASGAALDGLDGLDRWEWDVDGGQGEWDDPPLEAIFYDGEAQDAEDAGVLMWDPLDEEGEAWDGGGRIPGLAKQARAALNGEARGRAITAYHWGQRLSGVAFSPGGAVSIVMYRKDWEGRLKQKRHMEPIWTA